MIEENFYGGILRRDQASPDLHWGIQVADDLLRPKFHISRIQAFRARLMRNFRFIFIFLLVAWIAHRMASIQQAPTPALAALPAWFPDVAVGVVYVALLCVAVFTPKVERPEVAYWPHPDHPGEDISSLDV